MEKIDPLISKFEETNSYVIYVLGTTASGKSQLAFDIAKRYNGVIINADSMQVYKKFGIMTAKPSEEEMSIVPHRLYDYVEIDSTDYSVNKWISDVEKEILNVLTEGKIPIICGGTCNYIRSLIFENQIDPEDEVSDSQNEITKDIVKQHIKEFCDLNFSINKEEKIDSLLYLHEYLCKTYWDNNINSENEIDSIKKNEEIKLFNTQICFELLSVIDPKICSFLSEKDNRRIFNALRKFYKSQGSLRESKIKSSQKLTLRYPSLVLLLKADQEILEQRIQKRIDKMIFERQKYDDGTYANGISEIIEIFNHFCAPSRILSRNDFEVGILQSIGYKEFYPLYSHLITHNYNVIMQGINFNQRPTS